MKTPVQLEIDYIKIISRHTSERSNEIVKEMKAKQVLILIHKNDLIAHIEERSDSADVKAILLLRHKSEIDLLGATSQKDWIKLLTSQKKELLKHAKNS